jgi:hypothetical protein
MRSVSFLNNCIQALRLGGGRTQLSPFGGSFIVTSLLVVAIMPNGHHRLHDIFTISAYDNKQYCHVHSSHRITAHVFTRAGRQKVISVSGFPEHWLVKEIVWFKINSPICVTVVRHSTCLSNYSPHSTLPVGNETSLRSYSWRRFPASRCSGRSRLLCDGIHMREGETG